MIHRSLFAPGFRAATLVLGTCCLAPLTGCAGRSSVPQRLEHEHGNAMVTLQIRADQIAPAPDVRIPLYSAVCWLHAAPIGRPIEVKLDRSPGVCGSCATILGFGATKDGRALTDAKIAPSSVALICFHESGDFRYTISGLDKALSGTIHVDANAGGKP